LAFDEDDPIDGNGRTPGDYSRCVEIHRQAGQVAAPLSDYLNQGEGTKHGDQFEEDADAQPDPVQLIGPNEGVYRTSAVRGFQIPHNDHPELATPVEYEEDQRSDECFDEPGLVLRKRESLFEAAGIYVNYGGAIRRLKNEHSGGQHFATSDSKIVVENHLSSLQVCEDNF